MQKTFHAPLEDLETSSFQTFSEVRIYNSLLSQFIAPFFIFKVRAVSLLSFTLQLFDFFPRPPTLLAQVPDASFLQRPCDDS